MKKHCLILTVYLTVFFAAANCNPGSLFPRIKGWEVKTDKVIYNKLNLWEYINGAADLYLSYDFQNLNIAEYTNIKEHSVRVEIYKHSSVENAFGIYTAERMMNYNFIDMGVQGYTEPDVLNFLTGEYYVKMVSSGKSGIEQSALFEIAEKIENSLDSEKNWPDVIDLFPAEGKQANSENYIARDFLGYSFFHSAFTADYDSHEKFKMFIIKLKSETDTRVMLDSYLSLLKEDKINKENNIYIIDDFFNGKVFLLIKSNYIVGIMNTGNKDLAIEYLTRIRGKI